MSKIRLSFYTIDKCEELLKKRDSKKLKNNTYLHRIPEGYAIQYHNTDICIINEEGFLYRNGGYYTVTTKERLNQLLPDGYYIYQKNFYWFVRTPEGEVDFKGEFMIPTLKYFERKLLELA